MKQLLIWVGPVASEKTTHALRQARRLDRQHQGPGFVIRPRKSVRSHETPGYLVTKAGERYPSKEIDTLAELFALCENGRTVWIDEPMLFPDEWCLYGQVDCLRRTSMVLLSGCSATSELAPFGESLPRLMAVADHVKFCKADCDHCISMGTATRSRFKLGQKDAVVIGGEESYEPLCPACWESAQQPAQAVRGG